ncbi:zinc-binding dehydrogenase [Bacillus sp. ISL-47]|uniref:zinc-binding dehydrogenase n=1 Tax=Bacillus sp. ISL-47 TaxID=2819130 RepID=UPI001BE559AE|nr:zinc-binding dehydrogenase [Bacillus sp. ISL-47]MBT2687471.1 zinc-binding dehydrogenase [Bacillus sp. ISL-47]MBT2711012.1 zinc-binding dehydrogenase [Pseudomonas sp. ISL-84]
MKAIFHEGKIGRSGLSYGEMTKPEPAAGEVRVKLRTAGLNHRDLFVLNRHKPEEPALVIGSDGAGIIDAVGEGVTNVKAGDEVIINPGLGWKENSDAPPAGFEIVGLPFHGTFAEYIVIPAENAAPKPAYLTWEEAGVLSLAALTAYRALFTRGKVKAGMKVFIPGIGGGVATFLMQFAKAAGATVYVASRSEEKREKALQLGADKALASNEDWNEALGGEKVDLVIESVGPATFNKSLGILRNGGTIVTFGSSSGDQLELNLRSLFYAQQNLLGSTMGSAEEYHEMLQFIEKHEIRPALDQALALEKFEQAFDKIENAEQWGKIAFKISE